MISDSIHAVFFDAVGTVLLPEPGAPTIYAAVAKEFGLNVDAATVLHRFRAAYLREEEEDAVANWATSEERERKRWQAVVAATLPGAPAGCFERLYDHFAQPEAWRAAAGIEAVLEALHDRGLVLGLASNYDSRLQSVLAGRPELHRLRQHVIISSLVGTRKPGTAFFAEVVRLAGCRADQIAFVGDDVENDYAGATAAGMQPILLDAKGRFPTHKPRIRHISELYPTRAGMTHLTRKQESD